MNRRDTVLISVLVNMALLVVLFVFAIKPSTPIEIAKVSLHQEKKIEKIPVLEEKVSLDQVDNLLSNFVAQQEVKALVEPVIEKPPEVKPVVDTKRREIIVKQGDSLDKIAKNCHTSVSEIMKLNHLTDSRLHIGQILYVPQGEEPITKPSASSGEGKYYIVKHGDNPWTIAIKNGIKVEELLKLNNLDESKAKKLKPGDKLRIQ